MKILHVHIGTPKTATTSIQTFCYENREQLAKQGYCFTLFPFVYPRVAKTRNGRFLGGKITGDNGKRLLEQERENYREGMRMVRELFQKYDHVILSDESIWRLMDSDRKDLWKKLKEEGEQGGFAIHAIVYLRRQDAFFSSLWNQSVKKNLYPDTYEAFAGSVDNGLRLDYYEKLERMSAVIGKENVTVRRFEGGKFLGGSIYADFLDAIGLELTDAYQIQKGVRNTGLYGNTHEIKRVLNALPQMKDPLAQRFLVETLQECSEYSRQAYPCEMLSKEETAAFLERYIDQNRKVAEEYLHEPNTELFDDTVKDLPKWQRENPVMQDDLIRFIGISTILLYQENHQLKREVKALRKEAERLIRSIKHPFRTLFGRIKRKFFSGR